jgi:hypothetical protein
MNCENLRNNSSEPWLDCNNSSISNTIVCQSSPVNFFDIEIFDDQDTQIQQFKGSAEGTTIQNLEPGTYTVNEIKFNTDTNELGESPTAERNCASGGFPDGGNLYNSTRGIIYSAICFKYEDEQGNDCSTITLAAGEEKKLYC